MHGNLPHFLLQHRYRWRGRQVFAYFPRIQELPWVELASTHPPNICRRRPRNSKVKMRRSASGVTTIPRATHDFTNGHAITGHDLGADV